MIYFSDVRKGFPIINIATKKRGQLIKKVKYEQLILIFDLNESLKKEGLEPYQLYAKYAIGNPIIP